nr:SUKH-4 family immunity protein [Streptomyces sp. SID5468]
MERAETWVNGDVPGYERRQVRVHEFDLGFVVWAEDREGGPTSDGGGSRLVIAREDGGTTLWPALPVERIVEEYTLAYGAAGAVPAEADPEPPKRVDLEVTSFLLTPPDWLQAAADKMGIPDGRRKPEEEPAAASPEPAAEDAPSGGESAEDAAASSRPAGPADPGWAGAAATDGRQAASVPPPATVLAPPVAASPPAGSSPAASSAAAEAEAETEVMRRDRVFPSAEPSPASPPPAAPSSPVAGPPPAAPQPPSPAGPPAHLPPPSGPSVHATPPPGWLRLPEGGYAPVQPPRPPAAPPQPPAGVSRTAGGDPHAAATMLAGPAGPGVPPPPQPPAGVSRTAGGDPHAAATMLAGPVVPPPPPAGGPGVPPPPPPPPGASGTAGGGPHAAATMLAGPGATGGGYGFPQPPQQVPTVGPGYMAVLRYRAADGSEQQVIRRSAPGAPHPEWQILHELRTLNVPPQQVLELHTELESCDLPGGYCARMVRETWPQVRVSHTAAYGRDHASRQQGVHHLLTHQGELAQVADGPARPRPQRVPLPGPGQVQRVPPIPLDAIGQELAQAFGPQAVFRFDQRAVARAGVPDVVAQTLVWAGLPVDFGPFFWAQAQPGRPVPTLAEVAAERGAQSAPDASSYLVIGNDYGRQLCVQYGTAHIMAVPLEAVPGAQTSPAQFVNSSLPDFTRCLALLGRMWRLRVGLTPEQAGRWTVDFQAQLAALDPAALASPEHWWAVLLEQMWDGLL